ncbi:MAG: DUF4911 domain-containing protein [Persephonella sp.]|nr:MAG: DUF4911 domain-containing protein [Persephonella sp.]RUM59756.1 MAG: DUF4911 domain-containing protein [Persephonella sp.]
MLNEELLEKLKISEQRGINLVLKVNPKYLNFVYMVIDGHGRIGLPRTRNGKEGILDVLVSPDFVEDLYQILDDIKKNYDPSLEIVEELGDNWIVAVERI